MQQLHGSLMRIPAAEAMRTERTSLHVIYREDTARSQSRSKPRATSAAFIHSMFTGDREDRAPEQHTRLVPGVVHSQHVHRRRDADQTLEGSCPAGIKGQEAGARRGRARGCATCIKPVGDISSAIFCRRGLRLGLGSGLAASGLASGICARAHPYQTVSDPNRKSSR